MLYQLSYTPKSRRAASLAGREFQRKEETRDAGGQAGHAAACLSIRSSRPGTRSGGTASE